MSNSTIYDVARLAGVSTATVSRVFSDPKRVKESTCNKVYEAAKILNYHPSAIARAMAKQKTDKIAYLICKKGATILDEFYAGICEGVMRQAKKYKYQLLISTAEEWQATEQSKQIDGVILAGDAQADLILEFQRQGVMVMLVNHRLPGFDLPCVIADEYDGVRQVIDFLSEKGHTRIAMLDGRISPYIAGKRYRVFLAAMKEHGLSVDDPGVMMCDKDVDSAMQAALELLGRSDPPTAVFAVNDVLAAGVMKAARRLGMRLPDDLAVVGYDDSSVCSLLDPELTSVRVHCRRMGEEAAGSMLECLRTGEPCQQLTTVPVELRIRTSA